MKRPHYVLLSPVGSFERTTIRASRGQRVYKKELIYPGKFIKKDEDGDVEFDLPVNEKLIDHWVATFNQMKKNGIEVPLPIEHTSNPARRRGTVVKLAKEFNPKRGANSLYCYVTFRDKESESMAKTAQVSLYAPPSFIDGKGRKYSRPIRHVALTDYPLIPGLGEFEIAASHRSLKNRTLVLSHEGSSAMTVHELADRLGIDVDEDMDDDTLESSFRAAMDGDMDEDDEDFDAEFEDDGLEDDEEDEDFEDEDEEFIDDEDDLEADDFEEEDDEDFDAENDEDFDEDDEDFDMEGDDDFDEEDEDEDVMDDFVPASKRASKRASVSASVVDQIAKSRKTILASLVRERKITPAVCRKLEARYCSTKRVTYALSHSRGRDVGDDFDAVTAALSHNKPTFSTRERSGPQLNGHDRMGESSAIVRDAEKRANAKK
jgi:hypothetical protein